MEVFEISKYLDNLEQNLSCISCDVDKVRTLSKILQEMLFDNTVFKKQDSQNVCNLIVQELDKINTDITNLETSVSDKIISLK